MEDITLNKGDYNLNKEYELFDLIYSVVPSNPTKIFTWAVTGYRLQHPKNKRCFEYIVTSYPISKFIKFNEERTLRGLLQDKHILRKTKQEVLTEAKRILNKEIEQNLKLLEPLEEEVSAQK